MYIKKDIQELYKKLEDKFDKKSDKKLIHQAFLFAYKKNNKQLNLDGEPIVKHILNTSLTVISISKNIKVIVASILHHCLNLSEEEKEYIKNNFGDDIFKIIKGLKALTQTEYSEGEINNNPALFNYFFKVSGNDIRVFLIKICSRIDFIKNFEKLNKKERKKIAIETLEIYIPLIRLFGISKYIKNVEDLCYKHIKPEEYKKVEKILGEKREFLENKIEVLKEKIDDLAIENDIDIKLEGRIKSIYSLSKKMQTKKVPISAIYDLIALRIITNNKKDAYIFLGLVHSIFKSKENRIKDYISAPKSNGYQSIHTTVVDDEGYIFEIQIQTKQMYEFNIFGIASHSCYKGEFKNPKSYPEWMKRINNSKRKNHCGEKTIDLFQNNFVSNNIICITPNGDRVELPKESTILDFAFKIHSNFGKRLKGAYINGEYISNLVYTLKDQDKVNLDLSKKEVKLKIEYLKKLQTKQAKKNLINYFKTNGDKKVRDLGKFLLDERTELLDFKDFDKMPKAIKSKVLKIYNFSDLDKLYYEIGIGNTSLDRIVKIINSLKEEQGKYKTTTRLVIKFKINDYKNINGLFNVFNNLNINIINIDYKGILTTVEINVHDLETLNEAIVEISRLPNIYNVKRIPSTKMKRFVTIFSLFALWTIINPFILIFLHKFHQLPEIIFKGFFYFNIIFFISMIYLLKHIAKNSLPGLISQNFFWSSMFGLNTVILITTLYESVYIFKEQNTILLFSFVILLYGLTLFEYFDTKLKNNIK